MLLAVETSCDETAVALIDPRDGKLLANVVSSQVEAHAPYGGVVPELAARQHVTTLPLVAKSALQKAGVTYNDLSAIITTRGPGLKVCLLVGISWARSLAWGLKLPLHGINHLEGHLYAHELEEGGSEAPYPRLILLVSGGHTVLVLARAFREYQVVAETEDDAAGEAFDKSATLLGLPYPGGPELSRAASKGDKYSFKFPIGVPRKPESFSFSGMKTAVLREVKKQDLSQSGMIENLAASVEQAIVQALILKTNKAIENYSPASLVLTGGVAANGLLRNEMQAIADQAKIDLFLPRKEYCTDNAAMIGKVGLLEIAKRKSISSSWSIDEGSKCSSRMAGPFLPMNFGPLSRWPVTDIESVDELE